MKQINPKRCAVYIRKSTEDSDHQMLSLEAQEKEIKRLMIADGIIESLPKKNVYVESKSAGEADQRILFSELIQRVKNDEINRIYAWEWSRLSRNPIDGGMIQHLIQHSKLTVVSAQGVFDEETDPILTGIWDGHSASERKKLIRNIKRGIQAKADKGLYNSRAPIGYENIGRTKGMRTIALNPMTAPLVKQLFKLARKGWTLHQLSEWAEQHGLTGAKYKGKVRKLSKNGIRSILSNPIYYGWFRFHDNLIPGSFESLISKAEWEKVQEVRASKYIPRARTRNLPYRGLMVCGECGAAITACVKKEKFYYHHCSKRRNHIKHCAQLSIHTKDLEKQLFKYLKKLTIPAEWQKSGMDYLRKRHEEEAGLQANITKLLAQQEQRVVDKMDRLVDLYADGKIDAEAYERRTKSYEAELASIRGRREERDTNSINWLEQAAQLIDFVRNGEKLFKMANPEERTQLIRTIGWNLQLKDKKVVWEYKKPFLYIAQKNEGKDWWSWGDLHPRPANNLS